MRNGLPTSAWRAVFEWTALAMFAAVPASISVMQALMAISGAALTAQGYVAAAIMPLIVGGPTIFFMALRQQQLKFANTQLQELASTDWLTATLNRRAFTSLAARHLDGGASVMSVPGGALLIIDADDFKGVNDRHGHDSGDEALQRIAATIKANVREGDLVGRFGGEEFGVLLVGASLEVAGSVAERIRKAIAAIDFKPHGKPQPLSVSVGGCAFERRIAFSDLYRVADEKLYAAKEAGRNCISVGPAPEAIAA